VKIVFVNRTGQTPGNGKKTQTNREVKVSTFCFLYKL